MSDPHTITVAPAPRDPLSLRMLTGLLRSIPPGVRGKSWLARTVMPDAVGSSPAVVRNRDGDKMLLPNRREPVGLYLWMDGVYEPETLEFLSSHVTADSVFLDVGANIGAFAIPLARRARRVIAIEASPRVVPYLRRNVALNNLDNVEVLECAASAPDLESVPFYLPPDDHFGMASSAPQFGADPIVIPARSLDSIVREREISRISVIKIDTEGYEAHVLLGAEPILHWAFAPAMILEFCDWAEERAFPGKKGWAQRLLMEAGYRVWTLPGYLRREAPLQRPVTEGTHSIVGIPPDKST